MSEIDRLKKIRNRTKLEDTSYITELELRIKQLEADLEIKQKNIEHRNRTIEQQDKENQRLREAIERLIVN
jgi:hypothetical protein